MSTEGVVSFSPSAGGIRGISISWFSTQTVVVILRRKALFSKEFPSAGHQLSGRELAQITTSVHPPKRSWYLADRLHLHLSRYLFISWIVHLL